jgi:large repetitive protein
MVRRINAPSSSRLWWTVLCFALCASFARSQSADSAQARSTAGSAFVVAPTIALHAAPTSVAAGDLRGDGRQDLVITTKGSGNVTVLLGDGKGGFDGGHEYAAGAAPGNVLLADLEGRGRLDAVVTDSASGDIEVLRGNGDGTLEKPAVYHAIANPVAVAAGNFSGNGRMDLAVASAEGVTVLGNDGSGHFAVVSSLSLENPARALAAADLKGDGRDDLVTANTDGTLTVLEGDGSGHFHALAANKAGSGALSSLVAGDFNKDGRADIAVTEAGSNKVTVLLGRGDGSFEPGVSYTVGNAPAAVIVADVKGDGGRDLIAVNQAANTFSVLMGNGDGSFKPAVDYTAGNAPIAIAAGAFNVGGHTDLLILNAGDATISMAAGHGDGSFQAAPSYRTELEQKSIAAGDLNGDGRQDLVVTSFCGSDTDCRSNGTASVLLAGTDGKYKPAATYTLGSGPVAVTLADLNGDKKLDLIALNRNDKTLTVMPGLGNGKFGEAQTYSVAGSPRALLVGDFNGDGKLDIAVATDCGRSTCAEPGNLDIWLGRGEGKLVLADSYTVGYSPDGIAAGDLRGTGHLDLVVSNRCGDDSGCKAHGTASLLKGDGKGKFSDGGEIELGSAPASIALGSLTGKGLDLVVAERGSDQVAVMHSDGKGGFGEATRYKVGSEPSALVIADFDGDGHADVAVTNFKTSTVSVLYGTAKGTFKPAVTFAVGTGPESLVAVNGGKGELPGLVTANGNGGATPMGADVTALLHVHADAGTMTATTVTATPVVNPTSTPDVDQQVQLAASVTATPTNPNEGIVVFSVNSVDLQDCGGASGEPVTNGAANCTTEMLPAGAPTTITATYSDAATGDFATSNGTTTQDVNPANLTITVSANPASPNQGQSTTLSAKIAILPTPTSLANIIPFKKTIAFTVGTTGITGCGSEAIAFNATDQAYEASCVTTTLPAGTDSVTAAYPNTDANYNAGSGELALTVLAPTTTMLTIAPTAPVVAEQVTYSAVVKPPSGFTTAPTGTVGFADGGTPIACTTTSSTTTGVDLTVTCTTSYGTTAGSHSIVATYSGDTNFEGSNSNTLTPTVGKAAVTNMLGFAPASPVVAQQVTYTATVTAPSGATLAPTGTVSFADNGKGITCSGTTNNTAGLVLTSTCTFTYGSTAGTHSVIATYSGDSNYKSLASNAVAPSIGPATVTPTLGFAPGAPVVAQQVTYTATFTAPAGSGQAPTGTVNFLDNSSPVGCTPAYTTTGLVLKATCAITYGTATTPTNMHSVVASYLGDSNFQPVTSGAVSPTIGQASVVTGLSFTPASPTVGGQVNYMATVTPPTGATVAPTGTIGFADNGGPIGCTPVYSTAGLVFQATCTTTYGTATGSHSVVATYMGDTNYKAQASGKQSPTIGKGNSTTQVTTSLTPSPLNQAVTFTAKITPPSGASGAPTGTVTFADNGNTINCTPVYSTTELTYSATCATNALTGGSHSILATYLGDSNNLSSFNSVTEKISKGSVTTTIASGTNPSTINGSVTFVATVTPANNPVGLTGTVSFSDNGNPLACVASAFNAAAGTESCTTASLALGNHSVVATYAGDLSYNNSSSTALRQVVKPAPTSLTLNSSPGTSTINESVSFTATIKAAKGSTALSGVVNFTADGKNIPSCSAVSPSLNATASCTTASLSLGQHAIVATYEQDPDFTSSDADFTQTVNAAATTTSVVSSSASKTGNNSIVDQPVTFAATVTAPSGSIKPSGTVTFTDNGVDIANCAVPVDPGTGTAACPDPALTAGSHTIVATYGNDNNFLTSSGTLAGNQKVTPAPTTLAVSSSLNPSIVANPSNKGDSVTFTAKVSPFTDPVQLSGSVTFTDNGIGIADCATPVPVDPTTGKATCTTKALVSGSNTILAVYGNDTNYTTSNNTVLQLTQDYALAVTVSGTVVVTQGSTTRKDPFSPTTITVAPSSTSGFAGNLLLSCSIVPTTASATATLPVCDMTPGVLKVESGGVQPTADVVIDATHATAGGYSVTISGKDEATGLTHSTVSFPVTVRYESAAISITSGATSGNTGTVTFILPAGVSLSGIGCPFVSGPTLSTSIDPVALNMSCAVSPNSFAASKSTQDASVTVTVTTGTVSTAKLEGHSTMLAAGLLGIPVFALFGFIRGRKSPGAGLFRVLAIVAAAFAGLQLIGCGGSFTKPATNSAQTPPGSYDLLIQGNGSDGNQYQAVLTVNVTL